MRLRALCACFAVLMLAGCGSGSDYDTRPAPTGPAARREAADLAVRYIDALVAKDWAGACKLRTSDEQRRIADTGNGSCAQAFQVLFDGRPTDRYVGVRAGAVRIKGAYAGIDMVVRGEAAPRITLGAVRENGEWRIKDLPKRIVP